MQPFDYFITIDWSSRNKPSPAKPTRDAVWVAEVSAAGRMRTKYFRTREACTAWLTRRLLRLQRRNYRVLVGWDFAFGYPKGLKKALKLKGKPPWLAVWRELNRLILDEPNNGNNRFTVGAELNRRISVGSGPFWGAPVGQSGIFLGAKKDFKYPVVNKRTVLRERRLVERRVPKMQPAWKLAYAGSVGGQTLLGLPRLFKLAKDHGTLADYSRVWPFDTAFADDIPERGCVLHAEIYPSLVSYSKRDRIADRAQVRAYAEWLRGEQEAGRLAAWLAGPRSLKRKHRKRVLRHEGWVLGVE